MSVIFVMVEFTTIALSRSLNALFIPSVLKASTLNGTHENKSMQEYLHLIRYLLLGRQELLLVNSVRNVTYMIDKVKKRMQSLDVLKYSFTGKENKISAEHLLGGDVCKIIGFGQSMTPILASGQAVIVEPLKDDTEINKKDIVFCKARGHYYLHLVHAIKNNRYLIGNNHGHMNGWIGRDNIFGKVIETL